MKRSYVIRMVGILAAGSLLVAGCRSEQPAVDEADADSPAAQQGVATLSERNGSGITGEAILRWDPGTRVLGVAIELDGLEEGATYITLIAAGCEVQGFIHQIGTVVGGADGTGQVTTEVADVGSLDLDGGWTVRVARPPAGVQSCGEVGQQ